MRISCHKFYILEDLDQALNDFKTLHSIPPNDVRRFEKYLFRAYHQLIDKEYDWVSYSRLGTKLHEFSDYENKFGKYNLSEWLRNLTDSYESNEQIVRRIDRNPEATRKISCTRHIVRHPN